MVKTNVCIETIDIVYRNIEVRTLNTYTCISDSISGISANSIIGAGGGRPCPWRRGAAARVGACLVRADAARGGRATRAARKTTTTARERQRQQRRRREAHAATAEKTPTDTCHVGRRCFWGNRGCEGGARSYGLRNCCTTLKMT